MYRILALLSAALAAAAFAVPGAQASLTGATTHPFPDSGRAPEITEWTVPWEKSRPRDPFVDAQGRVWFVGQGGNYVAYLDPATGTFKRFEIDAGTYPHNLVVDKSGAVWFTGNRNGRLVKLDPASGKLTTVPMPDQAVRDPHTMTFDTSGVAWFTAQQAGAVGRLDSKSGKIRLWRTGADSRPYGIVLDSRSRPWFDLFGTNAIGTIDPATMQLRRYPLPNDRARPRRIAITSDGTVWYGDYTRGYLGRLDPVSGAVEEFELPGGRASLPYAMTVDDRDRIWVAETGVRPNRLVAFDPRTRTFTDTVTIGGGTAPNTVRHMVFHAPTRTIWFGTDLNTIGRATVKPARPLTP
jgi:virginiamycin B lyase